MTSPVHLAFPASVLIGASPPLSPFSQSRSRPVKTNDIKHKEGNPWEVCNEYTKGHTQEICDSWREEVNTLLIFAGLFSGVVTAFTIESYRAIKEDPAETTVLLLRTIIRQLDNMTNPQANALFELNPDINPIPASAKRVNTFWFLSLALSLSTVMAAVLSLQWIRAYSRDTHVSHREDVALHHMLYEGLKDWHVLKILSILPLLVITSLLLFFAGFIELLLEADRIAAIPVSVVVGIASLFMLLTTILPAYQCLFICLFPTIPFAQCPYKSPQAWVFQKCMLTASYIIYKCKPKSANGSTTDKPTLFSELFRTQSWSDYDGFLRRRRDAYLPAGNRDVGQGLAWVGERFVQHQKLVEAVCECLRDLPPMVALESSLARMSDRRANTVRNLIRHSGSTSEGLAHDLIVSHTLEHLGQKIEQAHMVSSLLRQRLDLFSKISERKGIWIRGEVDCPVNGGNVSLISRDEREQILRGINLMFAENLTCNDTYTIGAFAILSSILAESPIDDDGVLEMLRNNLVLIFSWIQKPTHSTERDPEGRLKQGTLFSRLIRSCRGSGDRTIIQDYRHYLDAYIKSRFERELVDVTLRVESPQFPYLMKYMTWRKLVDT